MENPEIQNRLIEINKEINKLGLQYLESQTPFHLSDTALVLKPFVDINAAMTKAINKLNPKSNPGLIPKANSLKND